MPTLTTTEQVLYSGPAATVTVDNTGSGVAWVRWEGGLEMVAGPDAPLRIQSQGRTIYGSTKSGTTDVTVGVEAPIIGSASGDAVVDGGTA